MSKLTEGPKNRLEAFCGVLRPFISCSSRASSAICVDRPETMLDHSSSIASTLGSLERELRVVKATRIDHQASFLYMYVARAIRAPYTFVQTPSLRVRERGLGTRLNLDHLKLA